MDQALPSLRVAADIGGTFTDLIAWKGDGPLHTAKVLSTPQDFSRGIVEALGLVLAEAGMPAETVREFFHATTVATNAILEEKGARTALITTGGFRDVLELRRIRIPELYNFFLDKPRPMVPRRLRFELDERAGPGGEVIRPLREEDLDAVLDRVAGEGVEAVAICLLHSYAAPAHEERVAARARERLPASVFVTYSADIVPEIREYERTSTVVINACVGPVVRDYLTNLVGQLRAAGVAAPLQVMMSNGGLMGASTAMRRPAALVESGPAAGVIGAAHLARKCGLADVITLDMGGTTAKAGIIEDGLIARTSEYEVGAGINVSSQLVKGRGHALKLPVIDLSEIGAGGGSIAAVDAAGILHVGPHSAGAMPGPACYDRGGRDPTLTDAMVMLGYLNPTAIAGGRMPINAAKAHEAIEAQVARPLGKSLEEAAHGVFLLAAAAMTRAVKAVSTFRGRDPRDFALIAFGGNGPLVAAQIADELSMTRIVVPDNAGVFSAFGLLVGHAEHEFSRAFVRRADAVRPEDMAEIFDALGARATEVLLDEGHDPETARFRRFADLRYAGQAYELTVPIEDGQPGRESIAAMVGRFHAEHESTYGHASPNEPVDVISLRLQMVVGSRSEREPQLGRPAGAPGDAAGAREAYFGPVAGWRAADIVTRSALDEHPRKGPMIVEDFDSTCLVPPDWTARRDDLGNIVLERAA